MVDSSAERTCKLPSFTAFPGGVAADSVLTVVGCDPKLFDFEFHNGSLRFMPKNPFKRVS